MDPNMSAALTGAIAGGVISLSMGVILRIVDRNHEKKVQAAGIKAELTNYTNELSLAISQNETLIQSIRDSGGTLSGSILINKSSDLVFIDSSVQKLGLFSQDIVIKIVELRSLHGVMNEMILWINGSAPNGINFFSSNQLEITQGMSKTYNKMISDCDNIMKDLSNIQSSY